MWRIKTLTEQFGVCGFGWKYEIVKEWLERGAGDEVAAFVEIKLYIQQGGAWSDGIPGTGGSMFIAKEKSGLYVSDECFKMALTDAISVSCKALGIGADVYWDKDKTKYDPRPQPEKQPTPAAPPYNDAPPLPKPDYSEKLKPASELPPMTFEEALNVKTKNGTRLHKLDMEQLILLSNTPKALTPEIKEAVDIILTEMENQDNGI
jgi:hypothetical protein